jgi:hypothetical protein
MGHITLDHWKDSRVVVSDEDTIEKCSIIIEHMLD